MEGLHRCGAGRSCAPDPSDIHFQQTSTRLNALSVSVEQSAEITILTDEGDTVMLSSREHAEADLLTYEHLSCTRNGYGRQDLQQLDFEAESEFTLAVQGDLNDQEMADIQALLKDLGGMLKAFLTGAGENDSPPEAAGDSERFETLSAFQADFEYRVSMHYLNFEADRLALRTAAEPEQPAPVEPEAAGAAAPVVTAAAADPAAVPLDGHGDEAGPVAARMAKRARASGLHGHRRMKHLGRWLENVLQEMLSSQAIDSEQARRGQRVIEQFLDEFKRSGAAVEAQMSRTAFNLQIVRYAYEATGLALSEPAVAETA
jgi:hypothetical protein